MTNRKGELTIGRILRDFPFALEMPMPEEGFGTTLQAMVKFCTERGIKRAPRGRTIRREDHDYSPTPRAGNFSGANSAAGSSRNCRRGG